VLSPPQPDFYREILVKKMLALHSLMVPDYHRLKLNEV
jgi:hypothetical protein